MGLELSITLYILSFALFALGIGFLIHDVDGGVFLFWLIGAFVFMAAHVPPEVGPYYMAEETWDKNDYAGGAIKTWYRDKETKDTVEAYIVKYYSAPDKYKLSDGKEISADLAIKNSGGIRIKKVMKQDNPFGAWVWIWDRIKIGKELKQ